jgi:hypothetical protein
MNRIQSELLRAMQQFQVNGLRIQFCCQAAADIRPLATSWSVEQASNEFVTVQRKNIIEVKKDLTGFLDKKVKTVWQ